MRELTYIDKKRGQLKGRFYELNTTFKKDPPRYVLCSIDEYLFRPDGKKRSEKELQNYATRLYLEKLQSLKEARKIKMEMRNEDLIQKKKGPLIRDVMQDWIKTEVEINCKKLTVKEYLRSCSIFIGIVGDHPI